MKIFLQAVGAKLHNRNPSESIREPPKAQADRSVQQQHFAGGIRCVQRPKVTHFAVGLPRQINPQNYHK